MTQTEALRLALEALYGFIPYLPLEHDKPQCDRYDQAITAIKTALEAKDEPVKLRRGDILRCIETDELCTVWATSTSGKTLVKWGSNDFTDYTAEQIGELFWLEPTAKDEPVAYINVEQRKLEWAKYMSWDTPTVVNLPKIPLYTTPPQRTWVGLTPACPQGIIEFACELEGVDLVCHLEYVPEELGALDSRGLSDEPDYAETMELVSAYIKGTDIDIGHLLLQGLVDHITTTALEDYKNDDL